MLSTLSTDAEEHPFGGKLDWADVCGVQKISCEEEDEELNANGPTMPCQTDVPSLK